MIDPIDNLNYKTIEKPKKTIFTNSLGRPLREKPKKHWKNQKKNKQYLQTLWGGPLREKPKKHWKNKKKQKKTIFTNSLGRAP